MFRLFLFTALIFVQVSYAESVKRTVLALYDLNNDKELRLSRVHQVAEMPLNHLGLVVRYVDLNGALPKLSEGDDVLAVLSWLETETAVPKEKVEEILNWSIEALKLGKRFLLMGESPFSSKQLEYPLPLEQQFWADLGLSNANDWVDGGKSEDLEYHDKQLFNFELSYPKRLPGYPRIVPISESTSCLLGIRPNQDSERFSCLVAISPKGAYVDKEFGLRYLYEHGQLIRNWYINPFLFFSRALGIEKSPRPDTTTLCGRRLFYSHIDGDGWNNETEMKGFGWRAISAKVLREKILEVYPAIPVTVAPIGADIDSNWVAKKSSIEEAIAILKLPNIETGCHTFTHPFDWNFFKDYSKEKEYPYLSYYPNGSWKGRGFVASVRLFLEGDNAESIEQERSFSSYLEGGYDVPRAFALKPFDLKMEVEGAVDLINQLAPSEKPVILYQWSGDCNPFYLAVKRVQEAHLLNINGGDSRFDHQYASYAFVSPLGREVEDLWQVYASNSNENTYTNLWTSEFWGYNKLPQTFYNTEVPIRVKPMNLYYHCYSLQKEPSYHALVGNIHYVLERPHIRVKASFFAQIANGFYSLQLEKMDESRWRVLNRGELNTIRFDKASDLAVDLLRSKGVLGFCHLHGSLYVHLDPEESAPEIAVKEGEGSGLYLIESSWKVERQKREGNKLNLTLTGFGPLYMRFHLPEGKFQAHILGTDQHFSSNGEELTIEVQEEKIGKLEIEIK